LNGNHKGCATPASPGLTWSTYQAITMYSTVSTNNITMASSTEKLSSMIAGTLKLFHLAPTAKDNKTKFETNSITIQNLLRATYISKYHGYVLQWIWWKIYLSIGYCFQRPFNNKNSEILMLHAGMRLGKNKTAFNKRLCPRGSHVHKKPSQ